MAIIARGFKPATEAQQEYLEILLNDCGYDTRQRRNAYLSAEVDREIRYLDDLSIGEASAVIEDLKRQKGD